MAIANSKYDNAHVLPSLRSEITVCARNLIALGAILIVSACAPTTTKVVEKIVEVPVEVVVEIPKCELRNLQNTGHQTFQVSAWAVPDEKFLIGEPLTLQTEVGAPSHVSIYHVDTSCKVSRLLHNFYVKKANEIVNFPVQDSGMQITVKPPTGQEEFYFVATHEPLVLLSNNDILKEAGHIASIDLSPEEFYERLDQVLSRIDPSAWSMTSLRTSIVAH